MTIQFNVTNEDFLNEDLLNNKWGCKSIILWFEHTVF